MIILINNKNSYEEAAKVHKKLKKRISIILISLLAFIVLYYAVIDRIDIDSLFSKYDGPTSPTIIFYTANYDEDIFKDSAYMDLDRFIYFNSGIEKTPINENGETNYSGYGEVVEFLGNMVDLIIAGDYESYNDCFSSVYYANKLNTKKDAFTMQKLYNITIAKYSETQVSDDDGNNYTEYIYTLEYMIYKNNGTFRNDIGSDAIRTQYIKLTDRTGEILIDVVSNVTYEY